jgi:hypothetical protein
MVPFSDFLENTVSCLVANYNMANTGLQEPTITKDNTDTMKLMLGAVKTPTAINGKEPFMPKERTLIFININNQTYQNISSEAETLKSRCYRCEFMSDISNPL